ncbi:hypothetical protein [Shewanella sp. CAL98-MNA-CIBAN-0140]|jgi:hypothetical protein|uniref:hypothetical protein n=1 Tax=unclassified Shewanella TaxID=196818 RepID=UPI003328F8B7
MTVISKIDLFFTNVVAWLIYKIGYVLVALLGITAIISIPLTFLEYSEGFADLDFLETFLIALFFIMIWRFVKKSKTAGFSYWAAIKKLCIVLTLGLLFLNLIEASFMYILLDEQGSLTTAYFERFKDEVNFFDSIVLIIMLYGLIPTAKPKRVNTADDKKDSQVETPKEVDNDSDLELKPNGI